MLYESKDNMPITQAPCQGDRLADYTRNRKRQYFKLRIATRNVGTLRGRSAEVIEMLSRCNVDIFCVKETRWKDELTRRVMGKNCHNKFFWKGNESSNSGVGILTKDKWTESILSISRVNPCIMMLKMLIEKSLANVTCVYNLCLRIKIALMVLRPSMNPNCMLPVSTCWLIMASAMCSRIFITFYSNFKPR